MAREKTAVDRAIEIKKKDPNLKFYKALEMARSEIKDEMDKGRVRGLPEEKKEQ